MTTPIMGGAFLKDRLPWDKPVTATIITEEWTWEHFKWACREVNVKPNIVMTNLMRAYIDYINDTEDETLVPIREEIIEE